MYSGYILAILSACTLGLAGCTPPATGGTAKPLFEKNVNVGVASDQPGLGWLKDGVHSGFDIDLAHWLGQRLGFKSVLVPVQVKDRETRLEEGQVDMVIAAYSKTDERKKRVDFVAPYMYDKQGVMTRSSENTIATARDIPERSICTLEGSTSKKQLEAWGAHVTSEPAIETCISGLLNGEHEGVSTDQLILAGYQKQHSSDLKLHSFTFGNMETYGVGLPNSSHEKCEVIRQRLSEFIASGDWQRAFESNFGDLDPRMHKPDPAAMDACE